MPYTALIDVEYAVQQYKHFNSQEKIGSIVLNASIVYRKELFMNFILLTLSTLPTKLYENFYYSCEKITRDFFCYLFFLYKKRDFFVIMKKVL